MVRLSGGEVVGRGRGGRLRPSGSGIGSRGSECQHVEEHRTPRPATQHSPMQRRPPHTPSSVPQRIFTQRIFPQRIFPQRIARNASKADSPAGDPRTPPATPPPQNHTKTTPPHRNYPFNCPGCGAGRRDLHVLHAAEPYLLDCFFRVARSRSTALISNTIPFLWKASSPSAPAKSSRSLKSCTVNSPNSAPT